MGGSLALDNMADESTARHCQLSSSKQFTRMLFLRSTWRKHNLLIFNGYRQHFKVIHTSTCGSLRGILSVHCCSCARLLVVGRRGHYGNPSIDPARHSRRRDTLTFPQGFRSPPEVTSRITANTLRDTQQKALICDRLQNVAVTAPISFHAWFALLSSCVLRYALFLP